MYIEKQFQQQLQRARSAFLQELRNHSVVVESAVAKIREELTKSLELKYGEPSLTGGLCGSISNRTSIQFKPVFNRVCVM